MTRKSADSVAVPYALLAWTLLALPAAAQTYAFTGALAIYGSDGSVFTSVSGQNPTAAQPAQCPADHPVSCSSIQEPYYCCPANNYCAWANSVVACCPNGAACTGNVQWQPTSTYWAPPPTTVVVVAGGGNVAPVTTTQYEDSTPVVYGGYCSTLFEDGPGLPTTAAGQCGTILILQADAVGRAALGWARLGAALFGFHLLGGIVFLRR